MLSTALLNLIVSIVSVGLVAGLMRLGYVVAHGRFDHVGTETPVEAPSELQRAA